MLAQRCSNDRTSGVVASQITRCATCGNVVGVSMLRKLASSPLSCSIYASSAPCRDEASVTRDFVLLKPGHHPAKTSIVGQCDGDEPVDLGRPQRREVG